MNSRPAEEAAHTQREFLRTTGTDPHSRCPVREVSGTAVDLRCHQ